MVIELARVGRVRALSGGGGGSPGHVRNVNRTQEEASVVVLTPPRSSQALFGFGMTTD